jgi:hypothetical protein
MLPSLSPTKRYWVVMFLISSVLLESFTLAIYFKSRAVKASND